MLAPNISYTDSKTFQQTILQNLQISQTPPQWNLGTNIKGGINMGREILIKTKKEIDQLKERVVVREPPEGSDSVEIQVDASDEPNITFSPKSKVPNARTKESSDTVFGQGTNPKPEDETYLSLLKGTTMVKPKVKIKEVDDEDRDEIEVRISNDSGKQPSADLNPSYYSGPKPK